MWAAHLFVVEHGESDAIHYETDRLQFLGRNGTARNAAQLRPGEKPSHTTGDVLDPIFSLRQTLRVPGRGSARLLMWTMVASTRDELLDLIDRHRGPGAYDRVAMLAWTQNQVRLRHLGISADEASQFQALGGLVNFPGPSLRPASSTLARDLGMQSVLWPLGVSGDLPIVLVRIDDPNDLHIVRQVVQAFEYWQGIQLVVDLVVLNDRSSSYVESLHEGLHAIVSSVQVASHADGPTGAVHVVRADQTAPEVIRVLSAAARVTITARRGDLVDQVRRAHWRRALTRSLAARNPSESCRRSPSSPSTAPRICCTSMGSVGSTYERREYVIVLDGTDSTPAPWTNVVANEQFGFHATAEGAGYTWWRNSRDNQLTPWRNDAVSTPLSEAIYVRNNADGALCSPTARPFAQGRHITRHGFGVTRYLHQRPDLGLDLDLVLVRPSPRSAQDLSAPAHEPRTVAGVVHRHLVRRDRPRAGPPTHRRSPRDRTRHRVERTVRSQPVEHTVRRPDRVRRPGRTTDGMVRRPSRVPRRHGDDGVAARRDLRPTTVESRRCGRRPGAGAATAGLHRPRRDRRRDDPVRYRTRRQRSPTADRHLPRTPCRRRPHRREGRMGAAPQRRHGAHARPGVRRGDERLAAVPVPRIANVGRGPATTRRVAPTDSAISCRTRWPSSSSTPNGPATTCCAQPSASSSKVTCSTGGFRRQGRACVPASATMSSGWLTPRLATSGSRATSPSSTSTWRFSRVKPWARTTTRCSSPHRCPRRAHRSTTTAPAPWSGRSPSATMDFP